MVVCTTEPVWLILLVERCAGTLAGFDEARTSAQFGSACGIMPMPGGLRLRASARMDEEGNHMKKPQAAAAPKTAAKTAAAKADLVTLRHLATEIAEAQGLSQKQVSEVLSGTITAIGKRLKKGARIRIAGLGTFEVRKRAERMGRNPATNQPIKIKASKKVAFRAAKDLSEAI